MREKKINFAPSFIYLATLVITKVEVISQAAKITRKS